MSSDAPMAVVGAAESYLLAAAPIVSALGLYELSVGKLEAVPPPLRVRGLGQFVGRIASLLPLMKVTEFFRAPRRARHGGNLLLPYFAIGVLIVVGVLYTGPGGFPGDRPRAGEGRTPA